VPVTAFVEHTAGTVQAVDGVEAARVTARWAQCSDW
jgi:hypothetical protein